MLESIGLICVLSTLSLGSNGFCIVFQSLNPFPTNGLFEKSLISQFRIRLSDSEKMASSQVEIASSAPFGCVLRDHNRRERCSREINARTAFQKNLKHLVCISNSAPDENSQNADSWMRDHHNNNNHREKREELLSPDSQRQAQVLDQWGRAQEMVTAIDKQSHNQKENSPTQSNTSAETSNLGGVSSLVQRWRNLAEAALNQNANRNNPNPFSSPVSYHPENSSFVDSPEPSPVSETRDSIDERFDTPSVMTEDSFMDWESDRTAPSGPPSAPGQDSEAGGEGGGEQERVRVADVIRRLTLTAENQMQGFHDSEHHNFGNELLPRLRTLPVLDHHQHEQRCFSPVINSPCIRGRQAFNDLLMQFEGDRQRELDGLVERRAVSRFSHRGRIQAMLRLRFMRRQAEVGYEQHSYSVPVRVKQHSRGEAAIGAQQHSHSRLVGVQQHSCHEEQVRDQQAAIEAPEHSHSAAVGTQQQHSSHGGVVRDQQNFSHEAGVGPQQHSHSKTTTRLQQHSNSAELGAQQHSCCEPTIGNQRHSCSESVEVQQNSPELTERQNSHSTASESSQPSTVVLLREKFDVRVEHNAANSKHPRGVVVNNIPDVKNSSNSNQLRENPHQQEVNTNKQQSTLSAQNSVSYATEDVNEARTSSDSIWERTSDEVCNLDSQESADRLTSSNGLEENVNAAEQEANNEELTATNEDQDRISDVSHPGGDWEEASNQQLMGTDQDWISDVSRPSSEWDEQEANNHDWINDISRPRSDWEGLRQARYQEMLDPYVDNEDIRQLLERRSVSTFLSSNLRDKMDQLMISRVERLPHSMGEHQQEEVHGLRNRLEQLMMTHIQRQTHTMNSQQEDEEEEEEQVEEEEESPSGQQYSEVGEYVDQVVAGVRSWSHDSDHEVSDDSDQDASPSLLQPPQSSQSSSPDTRPCSSFTNRSSIEMDLMYDLRGHIVQLHHEMSELRKSIKSCMNIQVKMQRSIKKEVEAAVSSSVRGVGKKSLNGAPRKRGCCVCLEMQVDALLYRCGHMCTCFKCAHELQWSSGKCPICRAPIVDVVRAYGNDFIEDR